MAKIISPFKISGSLGGMVFYENEFGPQVKTKGGPSDWHMKNHENFKNARHNATEWKRATAGSRLLRAAIGNTLLNGVKNMRLSGRMNAPLLQVIKLDPVHDWGERMINTGNLSLLEGFELNHALSLEDALPLNVENCYTVDADKVLLEIPAFRLRKKKGLPSQATHYRLVSCVLTVDFDQRCYHRDMQTGPLQAMGRKAGAAFNAEHALAASTAGRFWLLGIEFYTMEKDGPSLVKGGALRIMQWMGPVYTEEAATTPTHIPVPTPTPAPTPMVQFNYVSSGQQNGAVVYQMGQQGWYGTSSGMK
jgi:hypothetical protein